MKSNNPIDIPILISCVVTRPNTIKLCLKNRKERRTFSIFGLQVFERIPATMGEIQNEFNALGDYLKLELTTNEFCVLLSIFVSFEYFLN